MKNITPLVYIMQKIAHSVPVFQDFIHLQSRYLHFSASCCFFSTSAKAFARSSLFSNSMLIVFSCLRISAFCHDFSLTLINSQNTQYPAHIIENTGNGITMQAIRSMHTVTKNGEKYFLALSQVFFSPMLVVASPFCLAFLMPLFRRFSINCITLLIRCGSFAIYVFKSFHLFFA